MSNHSLDTPTDSFPKAGQPPHRPLIPRLIRTLAIPVILAWIGIVVMLSTIVPGLARSARCDRSRCRRTTRPR